MVVTNLLYYRIPSTLSPTPVSVSLFASVAAAWKGLQERNVVLEDTEEGYAAQLGDSVRRERTNRPAVYSSSRREL